MPADGVVRVELSLREREILIAWLKADTKAAVGETLFLADSTVRTYVQRIREKYERAGRPARSKAALVARAIQDGYISVDDL
ncbi:LuxR family transcriptional regulator [Mycobacterium sp. GA-1841]|nr:LuxR family transcriptional regulator [Mycobacterium sp. GA-1841]